MTTIAATLRGSSSGALLAIAFWQSQLDKRRLAAREAAASRSDRNAALSCDSHVVVSGIVEDVGHEQDHGRVTKILPPVRHIACFAA